MLITSRNLPSDSWTLEDGNLKSYIVNKYTNLLLLDPVKIAMAGGTPISKFSDLGFLSEVTNSINFAAANFTNSNWSANGWTLSSPSTFEFQLKNWMYNNCLPADYCFYIMQGTFGGTDYTVVMAQLANEGATTSIMPIFWSLDAANTNIYAYTVNPNTGVLIPTSGSPYLDVGGAGYSAATAATPDGRFFYAVNSTYTAILGYKYNAGGNSFSYLGSYGSFDPEGAVGQSGLYVTPNGQYLYCSDQNGVGIYGFLIDQTTGGLTLLPDFPVAAVTYELPAGSVMALDNAGKFLFLFGATSSDNFYYSIWSYPINEDGSLGAGVSTPPNNPVPIPYSPITFGGKFFVYPDQLYNTLSSYSYDSTGALTFIGTAPLGTGTNWIGADTVGNFIFAPCGPDGTIHGYHIDPTSGVITELAGSPWPMPTYAFLCTPYRGTTSGYLLIGYSDGTNSVAVMPYDLTTGIANPAALVPYVEAGGGSNGQSLSVSVW